MTRGFTKQKAGVAAYAKYNWPYDDEPFDIIREDFQRQCERSPEPLNFTYITNLKRMKVGLEGAEILTYSTMERRCDSLGNYKHSYKPNIGVIPRVEPIYRIKRDDEGWEDKFIAKIHVVGKEYIIPWEGPKTIQKLKKELGENCILDTSTKEGKERISKDMSRREKWANEHERTLYQFQDNEHTTFLIAKENEHWKVEIKSFEDFVSGDWLELYRHGKVRTPSERKYDELRRFGRELTDDERRIEREIPFTVAPGNKLDSMTETAEEKFREARGEAPYS